MKKIALLTAGLLALNLTPSWGQPQPPMQPTRPPGMPVPAAPAQPPSPEQRAIMIEAQRAAYQQVGAPQIAPPSIMQPASQPQLTRFNLDFPGGTPGELAKAIEKATGKPLNVIINKADADTQLPPLQMNDVDVSILFQALATANSWLESGYAQGRLITTTHYFFSFKTEGLATDSSIWSFRVDKPFPPSTEVKQCQFYSLTGYLNRGFTVDDITTAIQAGWKLAGETNPPELNYHKETQLLMAYDTETKLKTIRQVLDSLPQAKESLVQQQLKEANDKISDLQRQLNPIKRPPVVLPPNNIARPPFLPAGTPIPTTDN